MQADSMSAPRSSSNGDRSSRDSKRDSSRRERSRSKERREGHSSRSERRRSRSRSKERSSRRRRSASRSPSPIRWKRRRKSLWDKAPTGLETSALVSAGDTSQSRQARRLYVGNLLKDVNDVELAEFFNKLMYDAKVTKEDNPEPVIAVQMNPSQNFAFLEFTCAEDATAGMEFDGTEMRGQKLKVRRPKDYQESIPAIDLIGGGVALLPDVVSNTMDEGPNKIFIGGLPSYLNEDQVKELVGAFGALRSFNLVKDSTTGVSKGFAFFEYAEPEVTDRACLGLNAMKVGEKSILVQRANIGAKTQMPKGHGESILYNPTALNFLNLQMPIAAATKILGIDMSDHGPPTTILQLINCISPEDMLYDNEFEDILDDIREECSKYGNIVSMYVPRAPTRLRDADGNPEPIREPWWSIGRVFIEYNRPEEALKAHQELGGRRFAGHTVVTGFFSEDRYFRKDFVPDQQEEYGFVEMFKRQQQEKEFQREMEDSDDEEEKERKHRDRDSHRDREHRERR